jgi:hypothetical protein
MIEKRISAGFKPAPGETAVVMLPVYMNWTTSFPNTGDTK